MNKQEFKCIIKEIIAEVLSENESTDSGIEQFDDKTDDVSYAPRDRISGEETPPIKKKDATNKIKRKN